VAKPDRAVPAGSVSEERPGVATLEEAVERFLDDRVRQGLPRTCSDPAVMAAIASAVRDATAGHKAPSGRRRLRAPVDVNAARVEDRATARGGPDLDVVDQQAQ
jgi:hypothetical protein